MHKILSNNFEIQIQKMINFNNLGYALSKEATKRFVEEG